MKDGLKGRKTKKDHWIPDSQAKECPICEVQFNFFTRKHHCRSCGRIFCDKCTSTRRTLKKYGFDAPVRFCDICAKDVEICTEDNLEYDSTNINNDRLMKEWVYLVSTSSVDNDKRLEKKILDGIPNTMRSVVWTSLSSATFIIEKNPGVYQDYCSMKNVAVEERIMLDLPRTFPNHPKFGVKGSEIQSLFNVLKAYANFNPEVGYCQGMSFIVAVLLMHMNEENAFWVFVQMMKKYGLSTFFISGQETEFLEQFGEIFRACLPELDQHIRKEGCLPPSTFALQWIRTLFSNDLELPVVFRLWDIFLVQHMQFMINFIVSMFMAVQDKIMSSKSNDMLFFIRSLPSSLEDKLDMLITMSVKSQDSFVNLAIPKGKKKKK